MRKKLSSVFSIFKSLPRKNKLTIGFFVVIALAIIPLTVFSALQQQNNVQNAAGITTYWPSSYYPPVSGTGVAKSYFNRGTSLCTNGNYSNYYSSNTVPTGPSDVGKTVSIAPCNYVYYSATSCSTIIGYDNCQRVTVTATTPPPNAISNPTPAPVVTAPPTQPTVRPTVAPTPRPTSVTNGTLNPVCPPSSLGSCSTNGEKTCHAVGSKYGYLTCVNGCWTQTLCGDTEHCAAVKDSHGNPISGQVSCYANTATTPSLAPATPTPQPTSKAGCKPGPVTCSSSAGGSFSYYDTDCALHTGSCDIAHHCVSGTGSDSGLSCVLNPGATPIPPRATVPPTHTCRSVGGECVTSSRCAASKATISVAGNTDCTSTGTVCCPDGDIIAAPSAKPSAKPSATPNKTCEGNGGLCFSSKDAPTNGTVVSGYTCPVSTEKCYKLSVSSSCTPGAEKCGGTYANGFEECSSSGAWVSYSCSTTSATGSHCFANGNKVVNGKTVSNTSCICLADQMVAGGKCVARPTPIPTSRPTPAPTPRATQSPNAHTVSEDGSCGGKYTSSNQFGSPDNNPGRNFGDPNCDFSISGVLALINQLDYPNRYEWQRIVECESGYHPNDYYAASTSHRGAYGLFQMNPNGYSSGYDSGNVDWRRQVSNAINYNRNVIGGSFRYWACR